MRYPVLLVHGFALRDDLPLLRYWGRLPGYLRGLGVNLHLCRHDAWASVEENAWALKSRIEELQRSQHCEKINLIAHSKGGIESRRVVHLFSGDPPISSITTIATPHRGASLADWILKFKPAQYEKVHQAINLFGRLIGDKTPNSLMALSQLTTKFMTDFNNNNPNHPAVYYQSVASHLHTPVFDPLFLVSHRILMDLEGENDGVVGTQNCRWGTPFMIWGNHKGLSHIDVCDMSGFKRRGFDILDSFRQLLLSLKAHDC